MSSPMCRRVVTAALAMAMLAASTTAQNTMVVNGLPTSADVGYTFPQVGGRELFVEIEDGTGSRDTSDCPTATAQNPGSCAFVISFRMTYTNPLSASVTASANGYFRQGLGRFESTSTPFDGNLNTLLGTPTLLEAGVLRVTVTYIGRPTITQTVTVTPAAPNFLFFQLATTQAQAGNLVQAVVQMRDIHNNIVDNLNLANAFVTISGTSTTFPSQSIGLTSGTGTFSFSSDAVESVTVSLSQPVVSLGTASQVVSIIAAATSRLTWNTTSPTFVPEDAAAFPSLQLIAFDRFGNVNVAESRSTGIARNSVSIIASTAFANGSLTVPVAAGLAAGDYVFTLLAGTGFFGVTTDTTTTLRVTVVCDGVDFFQNVPNQTVCLNVTAICTVGTFQVAGPTSVSDRNCSACDGITNYQNATNQTLCLPMSQNCTAGQFQDVEASPSSDRTCAACGPATFSDVVNARTCSNVTVCVIGQQMLANFTATSDRVCENCSAGFVDEDSDPATACTSCIASLSAAATFASRSITVTFTELFNTTMTIQVTGASTAVSVASWSVRQGTCAFFNGSIVYNCGNTSAATPCGALTARHGAISTVSLVSDPILGLSGSHSVYERAITLHDSTGVEIDCADISPWLSNVPSLTASSGQTQCRNVTDCEEGEEESTPFSYTVDRTCRACVSGVTFKDEPIGRFCHPVQTCGTGFSVATPPNTTADTVCAGVTCPSLSPPTYGNITNCRGAGFDEPFLQSCTYSCNVTRAFRPLSVTRTCQDSGVFNGTAPTCVCEGSLNLDTINGRCVSECPAGFIAVITAGVSSCQACAATCNTGFFESTACDPVSNTDRSCSTCTTCPTGSFGVGGCFLNNNTDTVCAPFTECLDGFYEVVAGTPTSDRRCGACRSCTLNTLYAAGGCCGTTDTICDGLSTCQAGFFQSVGPTLAPQGGFGTDQRCQRIRQCGAGEYVFAEPSRVLDVAVSDRECRPCSQCDEGSFMVSNCTASADAVCVPHPTCPLSQYRSDATAFSNGTCATCATCASFEFIERVCGGANDTVCTAHTVCNPVAEFETVAPTTTTDRVCGNCTVCNPGEVVAEQCDTSAPGRCSTNSSEEICPRGTAGITNIFGLSFCAPCAACPTGTFTKGGARCPNTQPALGYTDPRCFNATVCPVGFAEAVAPSPTSDRECVRCASCPSGSYTNSSTCVANAADLNCTVDPSCPTGQFAIVGGTSTQPQQCAACRTCGATEFTTTACSGAANTVCRAHRECGSNEALLRRGTTVADALCRNCSADVQGSARPNDDPFLCPAVPFAASCPAVPSPGPTFASIYSQVTFSFDSNYTATVGLPAHVERHALFNADLLAYLNTLLSDFDPSPLATITSVPGSIVVTVVVMDTNQSGINTSHTSAVANLTAVLSGSFTFMYEGTALTIIGGSAGIIVVQVDPNSAAPTSAPTALGTTVAPAPAPPTVTLSPTTVANSLESAGDSDDGLSRGVLAAIVVAVIFVLANIIAIVVHRSRKEDAAWDGKNNTVYNPNAEDDEEVDEYLNMAAAGEADVANDNLFTNQVSEENRRLKQEVDTMDLKISEKNAVINAQLDSRKHAEQVLEVAVATKLTEENRSIQREIAAMKKELRKKREVSKFQRAAALQAKLKAERTALEDEITTSDEVAQVALHAVSEFGSLEEAIADNGRDEVAEHDRIAAEKARLSAEMAKMAERLAAM